MSDPRPEAELSSGLPDEPETVWHKVKEDFLAWSNAGGFKPNWRPLLRLTLFSPGFQLTISIRLQEALGKIPVIGRILRRFVWYPTTFLFGSEISASARIGGGVYIPHPWGIVIGEGVAIGNGVSIFQQVTLGRRDFRKPTSPIVKDGAILYAGAKVFGNVVIGEKAIVGSNAVVLLDVPNGCAVVGSRAEIISRPQ